MFVAFPFLSRELDYCANCVRSLEFVRIVWQAEVAMFSVLQPAREDPILQMLEPSGTEKMIVLFAPAFVLELNLSFLFVS